MASKQHLYTLNDVLNMSVEDISRLNTKQMREAVNTLNDVANKRAKRLESTKGGTQSFAYQKQAKEGEPLRFHTPPAAKGATDKNTRNTLYKALMNARNFVTSETSTVKGWQKTIKKIERAGKRGNPNFDIDDVLRDGGLAKDFWKFERYQELFGYDSESAISTASYYFKTYDTPEKAKEAIDEIGGGAVVTDNVDFTDRVKTYELIFDIGGRRGVDIDAPDEEEADDEGYTVIWRGDGKNL